MVTMSVNIETRAEVVPNENGTKSKDILSQEERSARLKERIIKMQREKIEQTPTHKPTDIVTAPKKEMLDVVMEEAQMIFDPQTELKKIRTKPRSDQGRALKEYKENLDAQIENLAELQTKVIGAIYKNPDASFEQLFDLVTLLGGNLGMSDDQKEIAVSAIKIYIERHNKIKEVINNLSDRELYAKIFNRPPSGKVEVIKGPCTLYFRCQRDVDYVRIASKSFLDDRDPNSDEMKQFNKSLGIKITGMNNGLDNLIIAEKSGTVGYFTGFLKNGPELLDFTTSRNVRAHEEQHAMRSIFVDILIGPDNLERYKKAQNDKEKELALLAYFRSIRQDVEIDSADEILAYFKDGSSLDDIADKLRENEGACNFAYEQKSLLKSKIVEANLKENSNFNINKAIDRVYGEEYWSLISSSVEAIKKLETAGFSKEKIIALLTHEPLIRWAKVTNRMIDNRRA